MNNLMTTQDLDITIVDKAPELFSSKVTEEVTKTLKFTTTFHTAIAKFINQEFRSLVVESDGQHILTLDRQDDLDFVLRVLDELKPHLYAGQQE